MNTETVEISKLKQDPDNARTHDAKNLAAIVGSLKIFGQQKPIVIDKKNRIVAGNGTVTAALELGWTEISAVRTKLTGDKAKAFALADNRTAELADWDRDILKVQLGELVKVEMDIKALGFDLDEVGEEGGSGDSGLTDPDAVPEVEQNVFGVKRGDIWQLGEHRVLCGDSTDKGDVDKLMDGAKADMVFTSPPYADMRDYGGNDLSPETLKEFIQPHVCDIWVVNLGLQRKNNTVVRYWDIYLDFAESKGLPLRSWAIWDKNEAGSMANMQATLAIEHEWLFVFSREKIDVKKTERTKHGGKFAAQTVREKTGETAKRKGGIVADFKKHGTVFQINPAKDANRKNHPATFPTALPEKFIGIMPSSKVYDPFLGSGSTLIACEKTNRKCYGMELDPHYCSVIIKRWQDFTGQEAKRIAKG